MNINILLYINTGGFMIRKPHLIGYGLISPTFLYCFILIIVPIITTILYSFWQQDFISVVPNWNLDSYKEALTNPLYLTLYARSLNVSLSVALFTVLSAFPIAYFISFYGGNRKGMYLLLITIPFWSSYLLRVFTWRIMLGYNGLFDSIYIYLTGSEEHLTFLLYNTNAVIITLAHAYAPFAILPIYVALEKIDRTLLEASKDLGDTPFYTFTRVILPLSVNGIVTAFMIVFIPTVGDYITPKLVGGKDGVMIANMIQVFFAGGNNWPLGAALAIIMAIWVFLCVVVIYGLVGLYKRSVR